MKNENIILITPYSVEQDKEYHTMSVKFIPFKTCNYHCPYCCETFSEDKRKSKINFSNIETIMKNMDKMYEKYIKSTNGTMVLVNGIDLTIFGGETFFVDWTKYLKYIKTPIKKLTMISNFSYRRDRIKKLSKYCYRKKIPLRLIASFHSSQIKFDQFLGNVCPTYNFIQKHNRCFLNKYFKIPKQSLSVQPVISSSNIDIVRLLYHCIRSNKKFNKLVFSPNFLYDENGILDIDKNTLTEKQLRDVNEWFDNKKLNICIESFLDEPDEDGYNREAYYTYSKSFELSNHPIDLKGWMCVDKYGFMIDVETGEIKQRCENPGISYGNILENRYDFSKKCYPVKCNRNFCLLCMHGQTMSKLQ